MAVSIDRHHTENASSDGQHTFSAHYLLDLLAHEPVILMGGPMLAKGRDSLASRQLDMIRRAMDRRRPVLGICLGAQLVARALGSDVYRYSGKEMGRFPVRWTDAAVADDHGESSWWGSGCER